MLTRIDTPTRNHGRKKVSAPVEYGTPPEILPIEMAFNFPLFPSPFIFTSLWLFFGTLTSLLIIFFGVLFEQALLQWLFQNLFKPKGAGTFFYSFKFYGGTFRLCCVITTKRLLPQSGRTQPRSKNYLSPQSGRTQPRVKTTVHKVDEPNQGRTLIQVHKVDGPHQGSR